MSEKIEVGYRKLGSLGYDYHHMFLLYTDKMGKQYTISGWTDEENTNPNLPLGNIRVIARHIEDYLFDYFVHSNPKGLKHLLC